MTMNQLLDSQVNLEEAHQHGDLSRMLKGVVANTHCLMKFAREAGLTPYMGRAHYLCVCYLKSQIVIWSEYGLVMWIWRRTCPRLAPGLAPWLFHPLCDRRSRVALRFMPLEHPRMSHLGCVRIIVVATYIWDLWLLPVLEERLSSCLTSPKKSGRLSLFLHLRLTEIQIGHL